MKFWECNQEPGEIIYIPAATIMTSLNIQDAFSYKQACQSCVREGGRESESVREGGREG